MMRVNAIVLVAAAAIAALCSGHAYAADIAVVTTAAELQAAINGAVAHIRIIEHLDLRSLPVEKDSPAANLFSPSSALQSITVRCSSAVCRLQRNLNCASVRMLRSYADIHE